jgi:hypothetical protein
LIADHSAVKAGQQLTLNVVGRTAAMQRFLPVDRG